MHWICLSGQARASCPWCTDCSLGSPLNKLIVSNGEEYVWPSATGELRGQAISPLYKNVVKAIKGNSELHELLSLVDVLRVGRVREKNLA